MNRPETSRSMVDKCWPSIWSTRREHIDKRLESLLCCRNTKSIKKQKCNQGVASARQLLSNFKWNVPCRVYIICTRFLTKTIKQIATQNISNRSLPKKKQRNCVTKTISNKFSNATNQPNFSDKKNIKKKSLKKETKILPWLSQVRWLPL